MRIGIVNDVTVTREQLRRTLTAHGGHEVIWSAANGAEAVDLCLSQRPELVLMDLIMPVMDGVEATRRIMAQSPCAILLVTADIDRNMTKVFEAMGLGALDVVNTPGLNPSALLRKIQNIGWMIDADRPTRPAASSPPPHRRLVAIGASAGGPPSLVQLLRQLPPDFPAAVVLVQHVDEVFAAGMAQWLATESKLPVRLACEGEQPQPGETLLAGTNHHLLLRNDGRLTYSKEPSSHVYRPSIDVFFDSVAAHWRGDAIGVLLTGMGRDGALGLRHMRERGFLTVAQDKQSSAVYGMPKAAAEIGGATEILPLQDIAGRLVRAFA